MKLYFFTIFDMILQMYANINIYPNQGCCGCKKMKMSELMRLIQMPGSYYHSNCNIKNPQEIHPKLETTCYQTLIRF